MPSGGHPEGLSLGSQLANSADRYHQEAGPGHQTLGSFKRGQEARL